MIDSTSSRGDSDDCLKAPASPTGTFSQASMTEVPSAQPSPLPGLKFEDTRDILDESEDDDDDELAPRNNLEKPLPGWPELAKVISTTPDFEAFPAFTDLNLKSLLYYQAELTLLRRKLHEAEYDDSRTLAHDGLEPGAYGKRLDKMFLSRNDKFKDKPKWQKQWTLIKQIRELLKEYSTLQWSLIGRLTNSSTRRCTDTILTSISTSQG